MKIFELITNLKNKTRLHFGLLGMVFVLGVFLLPNQSYASHIIGGEINYTCMGGDNYEISLTVYRDCFYANPLAVFDDPAAIGIFDSDNNLVDSLMLQLMNNDTLTPILSDSCLLVPNDVCVHTTTYRRTVNLPFRMGGYIFSYQRCCRNETINNIIVPDQTGATFEVKLSERALIECNSGSKFMEWPPLFICVNEPIEWDHSATDSDGDSLVYSLCTPFQGASFENNQPQPPLNPPYDEVVWAEPYGLDNLLGGAPLAINSETGMLTGTPNVIGQFVVGVCIEEYRDGELIATNRRDFQYNVGQCLESIPVVGNFSAQCVNSANDLTVDFINLSENANDYLWLFGDPTNPDAMSTEFEPSYTYPDTGFYDVTLITEPNSDCADSTVHTMYLKESTLTSEFDFFVLDCVDSVVVSTSNTSFDTYSTIIDYSWTLSDGQTSNVQNPVFAIPQTEEMTLTLVATSEDGCSESLSETFFANVLDDGDVVDTLLICPGASININTTPFERENVVYTWSPSSTLDDANSANPLATPTETTLYEVTVMDTINNCSGSFGVLVEIQTNGGSILTNDTTFCSQNFTIQADSNALVSMQWSTDADFSTTLSTNASVTVDASGLNTYYLAVEDEIGCQFTDAVDVAGGILDVTFETPSLGCIGTQIALSVDNLDSNDELTYEWTADLELSHPTSDNTLLTLSEAGPQTYGIFVENQFGCSVGTNVNMFVLDDSSPTGFDTNNDCSSSSMTLINTHINADYYQWIFGAVATPDSIVVGPTALYTFATTGSQLVTLAPIDDLPCDLGTYQETINTADYILDVSNIQTNQMRCSTDPYSLNPVGNTSYTYNWSPATGLDNPNAVNPISSATATTTYTVVVSNASGCSVEQTVVLEVAEDLLDAEFEWIYSDCVESAIVNFDAQSTYSGGAIESYAWTYNTDETSDQANFTTSLNTGAAVPVTLAVTTTDGCTATNTEMLNVALLDLDLPANQLLCNGASLELNVNGNANYTYSWSPATALSSTAIANPIANPTETTEYAVTVFDQNTGCEVTQTVMLEVPEVLTAALALEYIDCTGPAEVSLASTTEYSSEITDMEWMIDGLLFSADSPSLSLDENTTLEVELIVTAENGCVDTVNETVEVNFIAFEVEADNVVICNNTPTALNPNADTNLQYIWSPNEGLDNPTAANPMANPASTTTYTVTISDANNGACEVVQTVTATVPEYEVNLDFEAASIACVEGLTVQFSDNSSLGNEVVVAWDWTFSNGMTANVQNPVLEINENQILEVELTVTTADGCMYSMTQAAEYNVELIDISFLSSNIDNCADTPTGLNPNGNPEYQYQWSPTTALSNPNVMNPQASPSESTIYTVTVTNFNGIDTCTMVQTVTVDVETVNLGFLPENGLNVCTGESLNLNPNANGNFSYNWNPSNTLDDGQIENPLATPLENTTYSVTLTNNDGLGVCTYTAAVPVNLWNNPSVEIGGEDMGCAEETVLTAITNPSYDVIWSAESTIGNPLGQDINLTVSTSVEGEDYFVTVIDENGCSNTDSVTVFNRAVDIELLEMDIACVGDTFTVESINLDPADELSYVWTPESPIVSGQGTESIQIIPEGDLTVQVTATNQFNCEATTSIDITTTDLSDLLDITSDVDTILGGEAVQLTVTGIEGLSFEWAPPIYLDDPNSATPIATPEESTMFVVGVQDENGCIGTATHLVIVLPSTCAEPFVFIPNSFTPNGDDRNDILYVQGHPIEEMHLAVFNRWGQKIFESFDKNDGWDGTYQGRELEPDVFGYYLEVKCFNGDEYFKKGNISLIR